MKKLILVSFVLIMGISAVQAQIRKERRAAQAIQQAADYEAAVQALVGRQFILEANRLQTARGTMIQVMSTQNYVLVDGDSGTVQFAVDNAGSGSNGIGGATLAGKVTNVISKTDKKGGTTYRFNIEGNSISGSVTITISNGGNLATARVSSTIQKARFTLYGHLYPGSRSDVFKGRPFQNIPSGFIPRAQFY